MLEGTDRVLPTYAPVLSAKAAAALRRVGVEVRAQTMVTDIDADAVTVRCDDMTERIPTHTVLWAAGVEASPLGRALQRSAGAPLDRLGRVMVEPDCTVPGHPEIFVIGDLSHFRDPAGAPLPGVAQVAMQQGHYVAHLIERRLRGESGEPFHYRDRGSMAVIGRNAAVAQVAGLRFNGFVAWLAWLFIHLMYLVEFDNRLLVLVQWAWNYLTWNRGARLITGKTDPRPSEPAT